MKIIIDPAKNNYDDSFSDKLLCGRLAQNIKKFVNIILRTYKI